MANADSMGDVWLGICEEYSASSRGGCEGMGECEWEWEREWGLVGSDTLVEVVHMGVGICSDAP